MDILTFVVTRAALRTSEACAPPPLTYEKPSSIAATSRASASATPRESIAKRYEVNGYVRNLPDGQVELVAEGEKHELAAFLDDVRERLVRYIRDERVDTQPATGEFAGFEIRH